MKKILKTLVAPIAFLLASFTHAIAQDNSQINSLLWEVSGNGLEKSSYLYGTIHMMCERDFVMKEKVKTAFEKSTEIVLELDYDDPAELQVMQKMGTSSKPLSQSLSKEEYQKLDAFLLKTSGKGAAQYENMSLTSIMSIVMLKSLNCTPKMYEIEFLKMAMAKKVQIIGLEKVEEQVAYLEKAFSNSDIIEQLPYYDVQYFKDLVKLYNQENLNGLHALLSDEKFMNENIMEFLLTKRNANWVQIMPKMMKNKSVFFGVGAAHLFGENGIINLLKNAGYTLKAIEN